MKIIVIFIGIALVAICSGFTPLPPVPSSTGFGTFNASSGAFNQGYQNLQNLNAALSSPITFGGLGGSINLPGSVQPSGNLQTQWGKNIPQIVIPKNPLQDLNVTKWILFDNNIKFCLTPRSFINGICQCPNYGQFVSGKCYNQPPTNNYSSSLQLLKFINRNFDGTGNNLNYPLWGSKSVDLQRLVNPNYQDSISKPWKNKPNARIVSNMVGQINGTLKTNRLGLNMLFTIWGQFLDHDITLTPTQPSGQESMNIQIPMCDTHMDVDCQGDLNFNFERSIYNANQSVRTNVNVITAWIDGSQIYGSDKDTANSLRSFQNGKLLTSAGNLLPFTNATGFISGDARVNQNIALTGFHTIFMREHNRICDITLAKNPSLSDQEVFQIARNYVTALIQHISFDQFLVNLLGPSSYQNLIGNYVYDPTLQPDIFTQFSAAGFRLGHPLINSPFKLMTNYGTIVNSLNLGEMFFNPSLFTTTSFDQIMNGLGRTYAKQRSIQLVDELRNFLFLTPGHTVKLDLFSFNIQRGRDHGIGSINSVRNFLNLPSKNFSDLFQNQAKAEDLAKLYQNPDHVDLWLGIIGQKAVYDAVLGELGIALCAYQFKRIRNGDKYWYQNVFPAELIAQIKSTSFSDVIIRNTGVQYLQKNSFQKY